MDFDKLFEDYLARWCKAHEDEFDSVEDMEDMIPEIYEEWADSPSDQIGGVAPREFFENITSADELVNMLIGTSAEDQNPCSLLLDRIAEVPECANELNKILKGNYGVQQKMIAVNLISEMNAPHPLELYVSWISSKEVDSELKEIAIEILCDNADAAADMLFPLIGGADTELKTYIAEILCNAEKDERTYALLTELFETGDNIPLYAGYIGKYGDERSAAMLYKALDDCNYLEFIEIKNAIERLGGVVDDEMRDFSDDIYYKAIKNLK